MPTLPGIDRIDYLVRRRFPHTAETGFDEARERPKPTRGEKRQIEMYRQSLEEMDPKALAVLYKDARAEEEEERRKGEEAARPFTQPSADADFAHWATFQYWTLDEAAALSLGKDPSVASRPAILGRAGISEFGAAYAKRHQLLSRSLFSGKEAYGIHPGALVKWAETVSLELPQKLVMAVASVGNQKKAGPASPDTASSLDERDDENRRLRAEIERLKSDALSKTERRSCLTILYALAADKYGFSDSNRRRETAAKIVSAVSRVGLSISDDTVRRWLKQAEDQYREQQGER